MSILEQPEEAERTGKREHVIFLMTQTSEETTEEEEEVNGQREDRETVMLGRTTCQSSQCVTCRPVFVQIETKNEDFYCSKARAPFPCLSVCVSNFMQLLQHTYIFFIIPFQIISFTLSAPVIRRDCGSMRKPSAMHFLFISCLTKT